MPIWVRLVVLCIYLSLIYELVGIPVPSVASTYQLLFVPDEAYSVRPGLLGRVRGWHLGTKLLLLVLPTFVGVIVYLSPLLLALWPPMTSFFHFLVWPQSFWLMLIGSIIAAFGRWVGLAAAWRMQEGSEQDTDFALRTEGMFAQTRNPILVGMQITFVGLWLIYPTWEMLVGFILFVVNMHFRVLLEEDFLLARYGENYEAFVARTHRYF